MSKDWDIAVGTYINCKEEGKFNEYDNEVINFSRYIKKMDPLPFNLIHFTQRKLFIYKENYKQPIILNL